MFKNNLLKFLTFLILSLIIYVFFKSEIVWEGSRRNYYLIYYIISILLLIVLFFLNFVSDIYRKKFYYSFFLILISFYFFEIFLVNFTRGDVVKKKLEINSNYDTRNKFEIYKALSKKEKISIIANVNEENILKSLSGASKIKTIFAMKMANIHFF